MLDLPEKNLMFSLLLNHQVYFTKIERNNRGMKNVQK